MQNEFKAAMEDYIKTVNDACESLLIGLNDSNRINLRCKRDFLEYRAKTRKMEFNVDGMCYKFHGQGCTASNSMIFIDWDFGYRSRWCGINPWKAAATLKMCRTNFVDFFDGSTVDYMCNQEVEKGNMFKHKEQYYFTIAADETFVPSFPEKFDTLKIEHFNEIWRLPKNAIVERFLRKSVWVWNQVQNNKNKYILKFFLLGKEIYHIAYDDIGYPESAIRIMSDDILKNLERQS